LGVALVVAGILVSAYSYFGVRESMPKQAEAVSQNAAIPLPTTSAPTASQSPSATPISSLAYATYAKVPHLGARIGTITLPTLGLSWPIYQGTTPTQLAKGVGHFISSVLPGQKDNTVLSGHRTTVFNRLGELKRGQSVFVQTSAGTFTYVIRSFRIVMRTDRTIIVHKDHGVLTLTTCYPFNNIGTTTRAFIVTADLVR
jgi:sortase A